MTNTIQSLSNMTMTVEEALAIQARHVKHYEHLKPGLAAAVAEKTSAHLLEKGKPYPIIEINRHIPRGAQIEYMCGVDFGGD